MDQPGLASVLGAVFVWALVSDRLRIVSAPIYFVAAGLLLAEGLRLLDVAPDPHLTKLMAEVTLTWVLFSDASRIRLSTLRRQLGRCVRLLVVGLPLTVGLGALAAWGVLGLSPLYAVLLGAALAPTDAALGASVMTDRRVPSWIRQVLNIESGLNDGIVTPVVTTTLALIVLQGGAGDGGGVVLTVALLGLPVGVVVGVVIGLGGLLLRWSHRRGWSSEAIAGPAVLALSLLAYTVATMSSANGFVAAFVAGLVFGASAGRGGRREVYYVDQTCGLASMLCWLAFGAVAVPRLAADWSWQLLIYALLSLTVVRLLPVALALLGARVGTRPMIFIGWFGPRGLASVVFALLAAEELHDPSGPSGTVIAAIGLTVLSSVVLHGVSARPSVAWLTGGRNRPTGPAAGDPVESDQEPPEELDVRHLVEPARHPRWQPGRSPDQGEPEGTAS